MTASDTHRTQIRLRCRSLFDDWLAGNHLLWLSPVWLTGFIACSVWAILIADWDLIEASKIVGVDLSDSPELSWLWRNVTMAFFGGDWLITLGTIPMFVIMFAYERRAGALRMAGIYFVANGASLLFERAVLHGTDPEWDYDIAPSNGTYGIWAALAVLRSGRAGRVLLAVLVVSSAIDHFIATPLGVGTGTAISHSFGAAVGFCLQHLLLRLPPKSSQTLSSKTTSSRTT